MRYIRILWRYLRHFKILATHVTQNTTISRKIENIFFQLYLTAYMYHMFVVILQ